MKKLTLLLFFISTVTFAQYAETIGTARPGQAIGPRTLGKKVFQVQSGVTYNAIDDNGYKLTTTALGTVFRYGLFERFDLNAIVVWQNDDYSYPPGDAHISGISNTQVGVRYSITDNDGWIPSLGVQGRLLLKLQDAAYQRMDMGTNLVLATGNKLTESLSLATNWGMLHAGNGGDAQFAYVVNLAYGVSDKVGVFVEVYGGLNDFTSSYDTGFSYLVNSNLQLDFSAGWQGQDGVTDWFADAGVSWRFDWRDEQ